MEQMGISPDIRVNGLVRGRVVELLGTVAAVCSQESTDVMHCGLLQTAEGAPLRLKVGDEVLVWRPAETATDGIILGRIGSSDIEPVHDENGCDDHILIEATKSLTLKVGDGSITIREDGRILIKGKDLVSHARRNNRIRGGSVQIN